MKLIATMPVRNEDWVLGCSLRAVLQWVDEVVVLDHASTDFSPEICDEVAAENPGRVHYFREENPEWQEMRHRQFLLEKARERGATHVAIVDADEVLSGNLLPTIRDTIAALPQNAMLQLPWACLARSLDSFYTSGVWFNNWVSTAFVDGTECHWKARDGYDFHHRHPYGRDFTTAMGCAQRYGGLMHLQFVSERRLRAKQALYLMTEVTRWPGRMSIQALNQMYGRAVYESNPQQYRTESVPAEWWNVYANLKPLIDAEGNPWQERRCQELAALHGRGAFSGLDLFGVV